MLRKIIESMDVINVVSDVDTPLSNITFDSRGVRENSLFIAISGVHADGHTFIESALDKGAVAIVCSVLPDNLREGVCYILVQDTQIALAQISKTVYDDPSSKLKLIGITGTNGKTTTATLLYRLFKKMGYKVGLISTISYYIDEEEIISTHTTPDILRLSDMLAQMVEAGCSYCFMEVSSHSVSQHRITGLHFALGLFTNLTLDHLDYHKTFENYLQAKKMFFDMLPASSIAIYNADDKNGAKMVESTAARVKSYSLKSMSDYKCKVLERHLDGTLLSINHRELWSNLIGDFNAYNSLAIYAIACELGLDKERVLLEMSTLKSVPGRFETIRISENAIAIVDYAHTPDALENVLKTIHSLKKESQKVIVVVGCGGDRDRSKRPIMASIAVRYSDFALFTSDNPRTESPQSILDQMLEGVNDTSCERYLSIASRSQAIKMGVILSKKEKGAILLVAGKGHETYQEVNGVKSHFDDREEIRSVISN